MSPAEQAAGHRSNYETQLLELVERGYRFVHPTDADGELAEVVGVRVHDNVVDVVKLRGEHDVVAMRLPAGEVDILAPRQVLWQTSGYVAEVLERLLALPEEAPPSMADRSAGGCWIPMAPGSSKWITADA